MVNHLVLFRFRSELPDQAIESIFAELRHLQQEVEGITGFQGGAYRSPEGLSQG